MRPAIKRELFEQLNATRFGVLVHLDARRPGVVVPAHLRSNWQLVLHFGAHLPKSVRDLVVTDDGIEGTLSFDCKPFRVSVPWTAVYALVDERLDSVIWREDVPDELGVQTIDAPAKPAAKRRLTN